MVPRSGAWRHTGPFVFFAALAVAWTWPLAQHLSDALPGDPGDNYGYLWNLWWMRHVRSTPDLEFFRTTSLLSVRHDHRRSSAHRAARIRRRNVSERSVRARCEVPFGVGDGLGPGAGAQDRRVLFYATIHAHHLAGGYIGRMPADVERRYLALPTTRTLLRLSGREDEDADADTGPRPATGS
jgi:hypothetical protein